jgi:hypothetical protein
MLQILRRLLRLASGSPADALPLADPPRSASIPTPQPGLEALLREEFERCGYFKPELRERVIRAWLHGPSLTKAGRKLSVEEKKALGLNPRMLITQELVDLLSSEGLKLHDPKSALSDPAISARLRLSRRDTLQRSLKIGARKFKWRSTRTPDDCAWCLKNEGRTFGPDIIEQAERQCTCAPYCRGYIEPRIDDLLR